jgi:hypothetical protein
MIYVMTKRMYRNIHSKLRSGETVIDYLNTIYNLRYPIQGLSLIEDDYEEPKKSKK